jgi:hypothetical protein
LIDKERYFEVTQPVSVEGVAEQLHEMRERFGDDASFERLMDFSLEHLDNGLASHRFWTYINPKTMI